MNFEGQCLKCKSRNKKILGGRDFVVKNILVEADIDSAVDTETMIEVGIPSIQLHTGWMCHLDADMTRQGLNEFGTKDLDFVVLENVGNLVCPAEFDTGAVKNMTILSVPEGHDKPLKYPLMYEYFDTGNQIPDYVEKAA